MNWAREGSVAGHWYRLSPRGTTVDTFLIVMLVIVVVVGTAMKRAFAAVSSSETGRSIAAKVVKKYLG